MSKFDPCNTGALTRVDGFPKPPVDTDNRVESLTVDIARERPVRPAGEASVGRPNASPSSETQPFRPRDRPTVPVLVVIDDNQASGQCVRIRHSPCRIGRTMGDLVFGLDKQMSAAHAEIYLESSQGQATWRLRDLQSRNGTLVRASQAPLKPTQTFQIGLHRFQFVVNNEDNSDPSKSPNGARVVSDNWELRGRGPALLEFQPDGNSTRHELTAPTIWIGRDPRQCEIVLDDPLVELRHARVQRDDRGMWKLECERTLNGVWVAIDELVVSHAMKFQCGEQRFQIKMT